MQRRSLVKALAAAPLAVAVRSRAQAAIPKQKITRIRFYESPASRDMVNQSFHVITVETDAGLMGIGEGGSKDAVVQLGQMLIGEDPSQIDRLWQIMYRGLFYPAGREKTHAIGGIDMALWDLKGKALGVPVWELLGGQARDVILCYATGYLTGKTPRERAQACIADGFKAYRTGPADFTGGYDARDALRRTFKECEEIRAGVGKNGEWCIDYHTRFDFADAVRLSALLEPLDPLFCEDLVRSENPGVYRQLRPMVKVPIAVGEQFGARWDCNELIENRLIDFSRVTLPNCGGITEYMKLAALCETHYVALAPHFTGPIATAALVHCNTVFSGLVLMEMLIGGTALVHYLPESYDFKKGRLYPNQRPGLGVTLDTKPLKLVAEVTDRPPGTAPWIPRNKLLKRPDGSYTNW